MVVMVVVAAAAVSDDEVVVVVVVVVQAMTKVMGDGGGVDMTAAAVATLTEALSFSFQASGRKCFRCFGVSF